MRFFPARQPFLKKKVNAQFYCKQSCRASVTPHHLLSARLTLLTGVPVVVSAVLVT